MNLLRSALLITTTLVSSQVLYAMDAEELTKKNHDKAGDSKAVVILHVNWGRQWNCAGFENAQLQVLKFSRLPNGDAIVSLETPSKLMAKSSFIPYVLLVEPGEYAISEFDVKVARSSRDVGHLKGGASDLFKEGKPVGGTFAASAGEIVYLGHFGLDCQKEPVPWRYYVEGRKEFDRYVRGFQEEFPFLKGKPVQFRLFSTTMFGQQYSLE